MLIKLLRLLLTLTVNLIPLEAQAQQLEVFCTVQKTYSWMRGNEEDISKFSKSRRELSFHLKIDTKKEEVKEWALVEEPSISQAKDVLIKENTLIAYFHNSMFASIYNLNLSSMSISIEFMGRGPSTITWSGSCIKQ